VSKLVRDRVLEIIRSQGTEPDFHVAGPQEYASRLRDKLQEEVAEFLESGSPEELADILEVVHALAEQAGVSRQQLERQQEGKARSHGGFRGRIIWDGNQ
jgi:predicted house-cleaning noncanonical NTP pyrophosphatase (MazG superfamily)